MPVPSALNFLPGVQRDGTRLDSDCSIDSLWTRWRLGRPRKMLGYKDVYAQLAGPGRRVHMFYQGSNTIIHIGTSKSLEQIVIDQDGNFVSHADRTPAIFISGPNAGWTLDAVFDTVSSAVVLIAHSVPSIDIPASNTPTVPFLGIITETTPLEPFANPNPTDGGAYTTPKVAGGIVCVQPYIFDFDSGGMVGWSAPNLPNYLGVTGGSSGAGQARVSAQKIVAGQALRGGGANSPAALFWSLSEVITAQFVGSPVYFAFNTVSPSSSILSGQSVIEYDGLYFWAGIDRFLVYNGTVVEVPNKYNQDWFFDNLNRSAAGKSFAFKVPHMGEIWFCAPLFGATEPSHAAIYNVRENCWYDTVLPDGGRGAGYFAQGFPYPVMTDVVKGGSGYGLWLHEYGFDKVVGTTPSPIRSYFETPYLGGPRASPPDDHATSVNFLEVDAVQAGDMTAWVTGSFNARANDFASEPVVIPAIPATPGQQIVGFQTSRRLAQIHFESNCLGGNYVFGKTIGHYSQGDQHVTGGPPSPVPTPNGS